VAETKPGLESLGTLREAIRGVESLPPTERQDWRKCKRPQVWSRFSIIKMSSEASQTQVWKQLHSSVITFVTHRHGNACVPWALALLLVSRSSLT
jgi:hypothetical protein